MKDCVHFILCADSKLKLLNTSGDINEEDVKKKKSFRPLTFHEINNTKGKYPMEVKRNFPTATRRELTGYKLTSYH